MKKLLMICVLVGATIINASATEGKRCENSSEELSEKVNDEIDQPEMKLEKVGDKKYQLNYMQIPAGKLTVIIRDESSRIIYRDVIFAEKFFSKNYDLSNLDLGDYQFEVMDSQSIKLMDEGIQIMPKTTKSTPVATVEVLDKERLAIFINNEDGLVRNLKIFDNGELIHEDAVEGEQFGKKFKFENVKSLSTLSIQVSDAAGNTKYISSLSL
ncbi:hypothetical protein [Lunatibacter salilacus]|uniref:hypothetical protein n=1 Tax=Lunatibacter salilacus TaxID=2483804 RepID=UPI00131B81CC|nr:hypothetical protein [Lunatibacter salilacus]